MIRSRSRYQHMEWVGTKDAQNEKNDLMNLDKASEKNNWRTLPLVNRSVEKSTKAGHTEKKREDADFGHSYSTGN